MGAIAKALTRLNPFKKGRLSAKSQLLERLPREWQQKLKARRTHKARLSNFSAFDKNVQNVQGATDNVARDQDYIGSAKEGKHPEGVRDFTYAFKKEGASFKSGGTLDRDAALELVKQDGRKLAKLDDGFKSDRKIVLAAVKQDGDALRHAGGALQSDREVVLAAVTHGGGLALFYADDGFKSDRGIVLAAVRKNHDALFYADEGFVSDRRIL